MYKSKKYTEAGKIRRQKDMNVGEVLTQEQHRPRENAEVKS